MYIKIAFFFMWNDGDTLQLSKYSIPLENTEFQLTPTKGLYNNKKNFHRFAVQHTIYISSVLRT